MKSSIQRLSVALATAAAVSACRGGAGSAPEAAPPSAVPAPAVGTRSFTPPADGRLTAAQVEMYIQVGRRAQAERQASRGAPAQLADIAAAERRAASELGRDVEEFRWVSARIAEASPPAREALGGLADSIEAAAVASRVRILEKPGDQPAPAEPGATGRDAAARAGNRQLLERYRADLDALRPRPAVPAPEPPRR